MKNEENEIIKEFPVFLEDVVVKELSAEALAELAKKSVCVDSIKILIPKVLADKSFTSRGCLSKTYAADRKQGIFKPVIYAGDWYFIYEASLPKCYKGTNLYEITEADKEKILKKIEEDFLAIKIKLHKRWSLDSTILRIDYAKNVLLPHNVTVANILNYLQNAEVKYRREIGNVRYNGGGEGLASANNSRMLCLYNKIDDILKECRNNKRPIPDYITALIERKIALMRIEVRLTKTQSIRGEFAKIGVKNPTIHDVFNADFAKELLNREFNNLVNAVPKQYADKDYSDTQLLHEIAAASPKKSLSHILNSFALSILERDMKRPEIKRLLRKLADANKVRYILKSVDRHKSNIAAEPISKAVEHIRETLAAWQPLNLVSDIDTDK